MEAEEVITELERITVDPEEVTNMEAISTEATSMEAVADMIATEALATKVLDQAHHRVLIMPTLPRVKVAIELLWITPIKSQQVIMAQEEDGMMSVRLREGKLNL